MNLTDPRVIRAVLERNGFHFSKARGQNFLTDPTVPERIASYTDASMGVLEIGPGFGALTKALCSRAGRVVAVEVDRRLIPVLESNLAGLDNLTLIEGDALRLDLDALAAERFGGLTPVVAANLPYSITSEILAKLIETERYNQVIVMVQAEVAQRLCAQPGTKAYGAFTVFCNVYREPSVLFGVPPDCFTPRPSVDSSVVRLERRAEPLIPEGYRALFFRVVRAAFGQRRKTLKNALSSAFPAPVVEGALVSAGVDPSARGETLDIDRFFDITKEIDKRLCGRHDGV